MKRAPTCEVRAVAAFILTLAISACVIRAGTVPASGFYQIVSGRYTACCGIAGNDFGYDLPNPKQSFVRFTVDPKNGAAALTFLGNDLRSVFSVVPCPGFGTVEFSFSNGFFLDDQTMFHADPGPPPNYVSWNYVASNFPNMLVIEGTLNTSGSFCADVPTRFSHTNVVAVLLTGPRVSLVELSKNSGARIMVQGTAGWTNVIEVSTNLVQWTPVSTNVMDFSLCPICPFAIFEDSSNHPRRFYRAFEFP